MQDKVKITYRGWPGHYICADRCRFRLNTLIEYGKKKIVVSTVGRMKNIHAPNDGKLHFDIIGLDRYYETMAFWAERNGKFWDANVSRQISFDSPWSYSSIDDEMKAQKGHEAVVVELVDKLEKGRI